MTPDPEYSFEDTTDSFLPRNRKLRDRLDRFEKKRRHRRTVLGFFAGVSVLFGLGAFLFHGLERVLWSIENFVYQLSGGDAGPPPLASAAEDDEQTDLEWKSQSLDAEGNENSKARPSKRENTPTIEQKPGPDLVESPKVYQEYEDPAESGVSRQGPPPKLAKGNVKLTPCEEPPGASREVQRVLKDEDEYLKHLSTITLNHIKPEDVIRPHRNVLKGVKNRLPPKKYWKRINKTLLVADALCAELGVPLKAINSAYRSPAYNAKCPGAAKNSYHTKNMALDLMFECSPKVAGRAAKKLRGKGVFKGGIGVYSGFIHIDTRGRNANWGIRV